MVLAERILQMPVSIGKSNSISGLKSALDQPEFATAIGLVKVGSSQQRKRSPRKWPVDIKETFKQMMGRA